MGRNHTFKAIQIETLHGCNLNCSFCPNSVIKKNKELMALEIYELILAQLKEINYGGRISPYLMNEPLLDTRIFEIIKKTRDVFPDNVIMISTNGLLLTNEVVDKLFQAGLTQLKISCYSKQIYEKVKHLEINKNIRVQKLMEDDMRKGFMNRAGNINVGPDVLVQETCSKGTSQAAINYKGEMILCCSDYYYKVVAGNVKDEPINVLFNKPVLRAYRASLWLKNREHLTLCEDCNFLRKGNEDAR